MNYVGGWTDGEGGILSVDGPMVRDELLLVVGPVVRDELCWWMDRW